MSVAVKVLNKNEVYVSVECHTVFIEIKNSIQYLITNVNFIIGIQIDQSSSTALSSTTALA